MNLTKKISSNQYSSKTLTASKLVQASYCLTYKKFINSVINENDSVLDIGFGYGFLKPLIKKKGALYTGIEGNKIAFSCAQRLYGRSGFLLGFFPEDLTIKKKYNVLISLTTLDQVENKSYFIKSLIKFSDTNSDVYISVRNKSSIFGGLGAGFDLLDLSVEEWHNLFNANGFEVVECSKLPRPWIIGVSFNAFKNVVITSIDRLVPTNLAYMILFKLKVSL